MNQKLLSQLFVEFPFRYEKKLINDPLVTEILSDSRLVRPGCLFVAVSGDSVDGHQYISSAINNGAVAVVGEKIQSDLPVPYIRVENSRKSLAFLAAALYDFPARKLTMIGVTGTDGKTTTSNILYQILLAAGIKVGLISTVNAVIGSDVLDTGFHVTTPDAPDVQKYLARMVDSGLTHVILETTSHGWAQYRVDACEFDIGVVTNITHEHLDYHGSYENYRAAKARLFSSLKETLPKRTGSIQLAVLNHDDISYSFLNDSAETKKASYGCQSSADVWANEIIQTPDGIQFTTNWNEKSFAVKTGLFGLYNVYNCLAAITVALIGLGIPYQYIASGILNLTGVPGRMERIDLGQDFIAFVDFAHTPNALKVTLETARNLLDGKISRSQPRVIAVFG